MTISNPNKGETSLPYCHEGLWNKNKQFYHFTYVITKNNSMRIENFDHKLTNSFRVIGKKFLLLIFAK